MQSLEKELIERLLKRRIVVLFGEINARNLKDLKRNLLYLSSQSNEEIKILIDTGGGDFEDSLHFFDFLRILKPPITGIVLDRCDSMGIIVLQACNTRLATPYSHFLIHSISLYFRFSSSEKRESLYKKFQKRLEVTYANQEIMNNLLIERTKLKKEKLEELIKKGNDHIDIMPNVAKEANLIDGIISDLKIDLTK